MDTIGEGLDDAAQEVSAIHFPGVVTKLDVGKLRDAINSEEHVEFALRQTELADVDVDVAYGRLSKFAALGRFVGIFGQTRDAMSL